jgi:hypothetical protein
MNRSFNENNLVEGVAASFKKSLVVKALAPDHASACARACTQQDNRTATLSRLVIKCFRDVRGGCPSQSNPNLMTIGSQPPVVNKFLLESSLQ